MKARTLYKLVKMIHSLGEMGGGSGFSNANLINEPLSLLTGQSL
jgi:hypothetical protein